MSELDTTLTGSWSGLYRNAYDQGGMALQLNFYKSNKVTGTATDPVGPSVWEGAWTETLVQLKKTYIGKHSVLYNGSFQKNKLEISGTWVIVGSPHINGTFLMNRNTVPQICTEFCTFTVTGKEYQVQDWYNCVTCGLVDNAGCCSVCVVRCHGGHEVKFHGTSKFYCDCGAEGNCICLKPPAIESNVSPTVSDSLQILSLQDSVGLDSKPPVQVPNSRVQIPNSRVQIPNSRVQIPNSRVQVPNSSVKAPNSRVQVPNSSVKAPNSSVKAPNSNFVVPNSRVQVPNSSVKAPNSNFKVPNSRVQVPNSGVQVSSVKAPNSSVKAPNSNFIVPNSSVESDSSYSVPNEFPVSDSNSETTSQQDETESVRSFKLLVLHGDKKKVMNLKLNSFSTLLTEVKSAFTIVANFSLEYWSKDFEEYVTLDNLDDLQDNVSKVRVVEKLEVYSPWDFSEQVRSEAWITKGHETTQYRSLCFQDIDSIYFPYELQKLKNILSIIDRTSSNFNIVKCFAVDNRRLTKELENYAARLSNKFRASPGVFLSSDWQKGTNVSLRRRILSSLEDKIKAFSWNLNLSVPVIPMFQGTSEPLIWQICQTGFPTTEDGRYGKGMYFTSSLEYALMSSKPNANGEQIVSLNFVVPGNSYPTTENPSSPNSLMGKPCAKGYQSHYVKVSSASSNLGFPAEPDEEKTYDELILFQEGQVVVKYVLFIKK